MCKKPPLPGDIGLSRTPGVVGFLISLGQLLLGDPSPFTHTFIVIDGTRVLGAQPGGARYGSLKRYIDEDKAVFTTGRIPLTKEQRDSIVAEANKLLGTPYSYLDYLAIALHRFHVRFAFIEDYILNSGHMICSQLTDEVYRRAGIQLFDDGRLPHDVTPGDIANMLIEEW